MKFFIILFVLPCLGWAQTATQDLSNLRQNTLNSHGQLLSLRIERGQPMRIFVVGKEEAKVDLANLSITVRRLKPYPAKELSTDRFNNTFTVVAPADSKEPLELEVTTKVNSTSETFRFNLDKK